MGSFSRRDFLKGGAAVAAGSALAGAFAVTSYADDATDAAATSDDAAAGETGSSSTDVEQAVEQALASARVHETDVLVLGGGLAGMEAALRAVELGCTATIVDKGVFGHSGTSGINWGHTYQSAELSDDDDTTVGTIIASMAMVCEGLINQPYFYNLIKAQYEEKPIATALKYGSIPLYNEDGTVLSGNEPYEAYPLVMDQGFWPRMMAQWCRRDGHVTEIVENTYVLDFITDAEGNAAGAVGIDLRDGTAHVFRAKAVIMALGSYCWITGWNGVGAESMAGKECTGDGIAMLLKHGVAMADMEQFCGDASQWTPAGTRQTMGNQNYDGADTPLDMLYDVNGVTWEDMLAPLEGQYLTINMGNSAKIMYGLRLVGRGTEHGGVMVDKACAPDLPRYFRRSAERQKNLLGYELPDTYEIVPETWDSAGMPREISEYSETSIPGLFFASAAAGGVGGMTQIAAQAGAWLAANGAALRCEELESAPALDTDQVKSALTSAYGYLLNDVSADEGLRAIAVMHSIQQTFWPRDMGPMRDEESLTAMIAELQRIIREDLPSIRIADKSRCMNTDWRDALEAENMAYCALASAYASLAREETRGYNLRTDFPTTDNSYGLANTVTTLNDDLTCTSEMQELHDELVDADTLSLLVPECFGLYTFAE